MSELFVDETAAMMERIATDPALQLEQANAFQARWGGVEDVRTLKSVQAHLPQGVDSEADQVLERLIALERRFAAANLLTA
ncbi:MAG: hypothetical protein AAB834_06525, partial [Patescibacteria group bacterium]